MPVPSTIADLSTVADDNYPKGTEPIGTSLDNYIRSAFAFIKQLSTGSGASGTWGISITGNAATATRSLSTPTTGDRSLNLATTAMFTNEFASYLLASGYQKLPSGLVVQWGSISAAGGANTTVTFPMSFPTAIFQSMVAPYDGLGASYRMSTNTNTNSGMNITNTYSSALIASWLAIGY